MRLVPADTPEARLPQLQCTQCGLVYSQAAIAREMTLSTGVGCRRCGGQLVQADEAPMDRGRVRAARASISGWRHHFD